MVLRFSRGRVGSRLFKPNQNRFGFFFVLCTSQTYLDSPTLVGLFGLKRRQAATICVTRPLNPPDFVFFLAARQSAQAPYALAPLRQFL